MTKEKSKPRNNRPTTKPSKNESNVQEENSTLADPELAKQVVIEMTSELEDF